MSAKKPTFSSIDDYIESFPENVQAKLQELRATIQAAAPDAQEKISYGMPTFTFKGNLVYFAAWKNHIGFYGSSENNVSEASKEEFARYAGEKGSLQFPIDEPLPVTLITEIVKARVVQNLKKK